MNKIFIYLIAILATLSMTDAHACSCANVPEQQKYSEASDVFIGKVTATKLITKTENFGEQNIATEHVEAKINITKAIKGESSEQITVLDTVADGANCAVGLYTGREYLFYLNNNKILSICDGTRLYNKFSDQKIIEKMLSY